MNNLHNASPASSPIYLAKDVRRIEQRVVALPERPKLMELAGLAAAERVRKMLGERGKSVLIVAGPGNNGGDAFEVAAHLKRWFYGVQVVFLGEAAKLSADAARALKRWRAAGGSESSRLPSAARIARDFDLVVDGLFGIGLARSLSGIYGDAVDVINQSGVPVLALDVPSGLNADTGAILGRAIRAIQTVTFIALKPGLLTLDGPDHCGNVVVESLALDVPALLPPQGRLLGAEALQDVLAPRPKNFHKGNAGDVAILGGAPGMAGAALLAGRAALATGAGRVHIGLLDDEGPRVDSERLELMLRRARDLSMEASVIAAGPGLGRERAAGAALARAIAAKVPLVLDADALNLISSNAKLGTAVKRRAASTIITPHPAEAARLLHTTTAKVQADRLATALALAKELRAWTVLKGNGSIVAGPDGSWWINSSGHSGMASAGMGDALTGVVASLAAQGANPGAALRAAVWLHGAAGEAVSARHGGPLGTLAGDVIHEARHLLNQHLTQL